ncbi:hypothetical protein SCA6_002069 [Theobroma cacao]
MLSVKFERKRCDDSNSQSRAYQDSLNGSRAFLGLKRKLPDCHHHKMRPQIHSSQTLLAHWFYGLIS